MKKLMAIRHDQWEKKKRDFHIKQMETLKKSILDHAEAELRKVVNRQKVLDEQRKRAERDAAIANKKKEQGTADEQDGQIASG